LTYCNAGHNPPYLISAQNPGVVQALGRTGMAIGIEEEATWKQATVQIAPGDTLLLYTDGIPDAQNDDGAFFEDEAMIETAQSHLGETAHEIQAAILEEVENFVGAAPQFDDITLMVLLRDL
jgi:sigma-B regulation protein RsbU (phosphoserine phosphatase)